MGRKTAFEKDSEKIQRRIQHARVIEDAIQTLVGEGAKTISISMGGATVTLRVMPFEIFTHKVLGRCIRSGMIVVPLFKVKDVQ